MSNRTLIAVVDEEPSWLATMGAMLSSAGLHALLLGDRSTALRQIMRDEPALAIVPSASFARVLLAEMGDACPVLVLVTDDLAALTDEEERMFHAAYEKPASHDRVVMEVRRL